eukprot:2274344-Lingulodinium_polyedra.AAC.1
MASFLKDPRVATVVGHMCRQGMKIPDRNGRARLVRKPTRWASSAEAILKRLGVRCWNEQCGPGDARRHEHTTLEGSLPGGVPRTSPAAVYPA